MASVQEVLDTQKNIEDSLSTRMAEFEKQVKLAGTNENKLSLEKLTQDYKVFKESVWTIFQMLRSLIQSLSLQVDDLDSFNRRNALLFSGIEESVGEDCLVLILNVIQSAMALGDIRASAILSCHRLGTKTGSRCRPILVRFVDINTRNLVWNEKRRLKASSTVLSEFLTKPRQAIFVAARKHFGITRCWTRDGKIIVKLPNNDRKCVATTSELDKLIAECPSMVGKPTPDYRPRAGPAPTAAAEPPTTRRAAATKAKTAK